MPPTQRPPRLKVKCAVQPHLNLACYLNIVEIKPDYIKAQIGKRSYDDIVFVPQTRLIVDKAQFKGGKNPLAVKGDDDEDDDSDNTIDELYLDVLETEVTDNNVYHIFTPIHKMKFKDRRGTPRSKCHFLGSIAPFDFRFRIVDGTIEGLSIEFQSEKILSGLVINNVYELKTQFKTQTLEAPITIRHVTYDWYTQQHRIGVSVAKLKSVQENILMRLIDPNYEYSFEQTDVVDIAAGRIRAD